MRRRLAVDTDRMLRRPAALVVLVPLATGLGAAAMYVVLFLAAIFLLLALADADDYR